MFQVCSTQRMWENVCFYMFRVHCIYLENRKDVDHSSQASTLCLSSYVTRPFLLLLYLCSMCFAYSTPRKWEWPANKTIAHLHTCTSFQYTRFNLFSVYRVWLFSMLSLKSGAIVVSLMVVSKHSSIQKVKSGCYFCCTWLMSLALSQKHTCMSSSKEEEWQKCIEKLSTKL